MHAGSVLFHPWQRLSSFAQAAGYNAIYIWDTQLFILIMICSQSICMGTRLAFLNAKRTSHSKIDVHRMLWDVRKWQMWHHNDDFLQIIALQCCWLITIYLFLILIVKNISLSFAGGVRNRNYKQACSSVVRKPGFCSWQTIIPVLFKWCGCVTSKVMAELKQISLRILWSIFIN